MAMTQLFFYDGPYWCCQTLRYISRRTKRQKFHFFGLFTAVTSCENVPFRGYSSLQTLEQHAPFQQNENPHQSDQEDQENNNDNSTDRDEGHESDSNSEESAHEDEDNKSEFEKEESDHDNNDDNQSRRSSSSASSKKSESSKEGDQEQQQKHEEEIVQEVVVDETEDNLSYEEKVKKALAGDMDFHYPEKVKIVRIFTSSTFTGKL